MGAIEARMGLTGGSQCGALRYRMNAEPRGTNICHCRMCQKAGGGPFMAFFALPAREASEWLNLDAAALGSRQHPDFDT
jgi:hypothetical protein